MGHRSLWQAVICARCAVNLLVQRAQAARYVAQICTDSLQSTVAGAMRARSFLFAIEWKAGQGLLVQDHASCRPDASSRHLLRRLVNISCTPFHLDVRAFLLYAISSARRTRRCIRHPTVRVAQTDLKEGWRRLLFVLMCLLDRKRQALRFNQVSCSHRGCYLAI